MRIPIEQILPDPDNHGRARKGGRQAESRDASRAPRAKRNPVVLHDGRGRYVLLAGASQLRAAKEAGESEIDCTVKEDLSDQEREELRLAEMYHGSLVPPMELGRAFMRYRDRHTVTQQELARRTGITPGTIHHYESLIRTLDPDLGKKVDSGELTFKEARSIADILGHRRQREIAAPFLDGRLSSVHVERVVGRAKTAPDISIEQLIEEVLNGTRVPDPDRDLHGWRSAGQPSQSFQPEISRPGGLSLGIAEDDLRAGARPGPSAVAERPRPDGENPLAAGRPRTVLPSG